MTCFFMKVIFIFKDGYLISCQPQNCGPCYALGSGCCNTCQDVINGYIANNWAYNETSFVQCQPKPYKATKLINYWPMSNLSDVVGTATLYNGVSYSFTADRFGNPSQAIYFNNGYLQVPTDVYFCGDFTTIVWINILSQVAGRPRYLDFSYPGRNEEIVHAIYSNDGSGTCSNCTNNPAVETWEKNPSYISTIAFNNRLQLNTWYHIAVTMQLTNVYIYINGVLSASGSGYVSSCIARSSNFIGASNSNTDPYLNAVVDELRIYQGAMTAPQILDDFTATSPGKNFRFQNSNFLNVTFT